jgi:Cysteine-rich secretory protein family
MNDLARGLREGESPRGEAVEFVLGHRGIVEPYPLLLVVRAPAAAEPALRDRVLRDLKLPPGKPLVTIGVGLDRQTSLLMAVVAIQDKSLDLDAVPRHVAHGAHARVAGKVLEPLRQPHLYVTDPAGTARAIPADVAGTAFSTDVACDRGDGRYQVEVFGNDDGGPRVLANFGIYCGATPPRAFDGAAGYTATSLAPAEAEARMLELLNRDRRVAGLPPLAPDPDLATVARAHSQDMLANAYVAHISPVTGGPMDRVKRAGIPPPRRLLENVGRASSLEELQRGLMSSPGHRAAILDREVTRVGIGVVVAAPEPEQVVVIGTQLFR